MRNSKKQSPWKYFLNIIDSTTTTNKERQNLIGKTPNEFAEYVSKEFDFDFESRGIELEDSNCQWRTFRKYYSGTIVPFIKKKYAMNPFSPQASHRPPTSISVAATPTPSEMTTSIAGRSSVNSTFSEGPTLSQENITDIFRQIADIKGQLLPYLKRNHEIGTDLNSRIDANDHEVNKEMIEMGGKASVRVVGKMDAWRADHVKLQEVKAMIETINKAEMLELQVMKASILQQQAEWEVWSTAHHKKDQQVAEFSDLLQKDANNQAELIQIAGLNSLQQIYCLIFHIPSKVMIL